MTSGAARSGYLRELSPLLMSEWRTIGPGRGGGALRIGNGSSGSCNMCQFVDNHSPQGGAIWVGDEGSSLILNNSMVYNNSAEQGGGGMYIKHGSATIAGTTFSNNSAPEGPDLLSLDAEISIQPGASIEARGIVQR